MIAVIYITTREASSFEAASIRCLSETPAGYDSTLNQDRTLTY